MLPQTRKLLEDFYAPFNAKLAQKLGDDRYLWSDTSAAAKEAYKADAAAQ